MFNRQQSGPSVKGYVDVDYVGDLDDRRSTTIMYSPLVGDLFVGSL